MRLSLNTLQNHIYSALQQFIEQIKIIFWLDTNNCNYVQIHFDFFVQVTLFLVLLFYFVKSKNKGGFKTEPTLLTNSLRNQPVFGALSVIKWRGRGF
jgi:hypothetical protein